METDNDTSQSRNAAKVAGFAAAIALTTTLAIRAKRFVGRKRDERQARKNAPLTVAE